MLGNRDCFGKIWVSSRIDLGDERICAHFGRIDDPRGMCEMETSHIQLGWVFDVVLRSSQTIGDLFMVAASIYDV